MLWGGSREEQFLPLSVNVESARRIPNFFELIMYIPEQKTPLHSADAAGKRLGHGAITNATEGDIPRVYPYTDFNKRLLQTDERKIVVVARHDLHRDIHRRLDLSQDAE